jgi:meiotic recombination protein SPO11
VTDSQAVIFRLFCMIHEALISDVIVTKRYMNAIIIDEANDGRDLYYRDPNLFRSQHTVDRYIDDIARSFGVPRSLLNVVS